MSSCDTLICSAGYAQPILDVLDPAGKLFAARLYRDATTATLHHSNVKVCICCRSALAAASWFVSAQQCGAKCMHPMLCLGMALQACSMPAKCTLALFWCKCQRIFKAHVYMQDLSRLGCDLARTVLVDDSPFSFLMQPSNGLPIRPFTGRPSDNDLLTVRVLPATDCSGS
jgi:NLI interacting factor-like phosphatase